LTRRTSISATLGIACLAAPLVWMAPAAATPLSEADRKLLVFHAEADRLATSFAARSWPGFGWDKYAFVVFDPNRVAFQFNSSRPLPGFSPLQGAPARGRNPVFVRYGSTQQFTPGKGPFEFVVAVGGQRVIPIAVSGIEAALPNGYSPASLLYFPLLVHLREQYSWFAEYMRKGEDWISQYPLGDIDNFALADLESACLKFAATATAAEDAIRAAKWFVAVRLTRQAKLSATSVKHENYQEILVAAARYGSLHLATHGASPEYKPLPALAGVARGWSYPTQADVAKWLATALDSPMDARALTRERLGLSGMGQAMLLDRLGAKDWRRQLATSGSYAPLLAKAAGYDDAERAPIVEEAKKALNFEVLQIRARGIVENNLRMIEAFDRQPGWIVKVNLPDVGTSPTANLGLRWEPGGYFPLEIDSRTRLFLPPYRAIHFTTAHMSIELAAVPAKFYSVDYSNPFRNLILRLPLNPGDVKLDGQDLALRPGNRAIAKSLVIKAPKATLTFKRGRVVVSRDAIEVKP